MPERVAYVNGWVGPESQARISIYDRGFLSGYGVFERTRTVHGELFRLDEHLARLYRSLRVTRLDSAMSRDELRAVTIDLVAQNGKLLGPNDDYSVGHYVTRGEEGSGRPTVVVFCQPIPFKAFARQYIDGAHVVTPSTRQMDTQMVDPKLKTTSRIHQLLAEQEAKLVDPQAYALVLDLAGNVCEAFPGHNFWIVDGGTLVSPKNQAILRGITRDVLVEVAQKIGAPVKEADIQVYDVINAQEAFLSGTSRCIVPVTRINGMPLGDGTPGPVVKQLTKAWVDCFGLDFVQQALSHLQEDAPPRERGRRD